MKHNIKLYEDMDTTDPIRFYPSNYPIVTFEPLRTNFAILESPEDIRKGLISLVSFEEEDLIAQCLGISLPTQTLYTLQHTEGLYLHDPYFCGYLLHSCEPNAKLDMVDFKLYAVKRIRPFDKITIDYEATEATLHQAFTCDCGEMSCRGWIEGYKNKIKEM